MIKTEYLQDGRLIRHYSDNGMMILQVETGREYADTIDIVPCKYTYEETDKPISTDGEVTEDDYIGALNRLGVDI